MKNQFIIIHQLSITIQSNIQKKVNYINQNMLEYILLTLLFLLSFIIQLFRFFRFYSTRMSSFDNLDLYLYKIHMAKVEKKQLQKWIKLNEDLYLDPDGLLGKGCFGQVFRGYSVKHDRLIAIKTMEDEGYERQVETLKTLSSLQHPAIMGFYEFLKKQDRVYIAVQFCPNGTLTDLIKQGIQQENVLRLFRQLIQGMCYMNAKGKMHRDLKPDNILIGLDRDIKISDFGLARQTTSIFVTGQMGTPLYAGPQVYLNKYEENYSQKCDVWGAGMILYEMLVGKVLFQKVSTYQDLKNQWRLYEIGERRVQYDPKFHPNWEYFTNLMLTYDPKKRPTFHQILQKIKKVYDKMMQQIKNKHVHKINQNTKLGRLQLFLQFTLQKYNILTKITQNFTQKVINIRSEFKYIIQFLCLSHYVCHIKKFIRNLKYKRIYVNQDDEQDLIEDDNQQFDWLLDKYRNLFEHKYNFYSDQISNRIVPKLLDDFAKKNQSKQIATQLKNIWQFASDVKQGTYDVEQTYNDQLKLILKDKIQKYHKNMLQNMKLQQLYVLHFIYLGALLQKVFNNSNYLSKNYIKDIFNKLQTENKEQHIKDIKNLKNQL